MALTQSPVYNVTISLVDRDMNKSTVRFHVPTGDTTATGLAAQVEESLIPAIQGISDAIVSGYSVSVQAEDPDAGNLAPETSDVERKGVFSFRAANGGSFVCQVPSIKNTLVIDETNVINKADSLVTAFITAVTDPGLLALGKPSTYLGADISQFVKARKAHRGSSRG
ncbi:hypothetical protein JK320_25425 [Klebsiella pneumoniae]|uniref:hypothetical protein n=1 Tax=Klebsiella pneumoniae TaxID=573 RepID=UPI00191E440A|nr:hypothetical protein [Klebsiella pneumoniae]MBL0830561.1 hypothetical protein [Klebsiella pneumoniae]